MANDINQYFIQHWNGDNSKESDKVKNGIVVI